MIWREAVSASCAGPSRALFLPRGLLDEAEIPGYLNGQLAGE